MFEAVGYRVKRLVRTRVGNLRLGDLPCGHWRALTKSELTSLKRPWKTAVSPVMEDGPPARRRARAAVSHDRRKRLSSATSLWRAR
jgi:hypothetical protein